MNNPSLDEIISAFRAKAAEEYAEKDRLQMEAEDWQQEYRTCKLARLQSLRLDVIKVFKRWIPDYMQVDEPMIMTNGDAKFCARSAGMPALGRHQYDASNYIWFGVYQNNVPSGGDIGECLWKYTIYGSLTSPVLQRMTGAPHAWRVWRDKCQAKTWENPENLLVALCEFTGRVMADADRLREKQDKHACSGK